MKTCLLCSLASSLFPPLLHCHFPSSILFSGTHLLLRLLIVTCYLPIYATCYVTSLASTTTANYYYYYYHCYHHHYNYCFCCLCSKFYKLPVSCFSSSHSFYSDLSLWLIPHCIIHLSLLRGVKRHPHTHTHTHSTFCMQLKTYIFFSNFHHKYNHW